MLMVTGKRQDKSILKSQPPILPINCEEHPGRFMSVCSVFFFLFINKSQHQHIHEIISPSVGKTSFGESQVDIKI